MRCNRNILIVAFVLAALLFAGCSAPVAGVAPGRQAGDKQEFSADDVTFSMVYVPGKRFPTGGSDNGTSALAYDYWMGETEVTYQFWYTVYSWAVVNGYVLNDTARIGSSDSGSLQQPVTNLPWNEAIVWCNAATEWYNDRKGTDFECAYQYTNGAVIRNTSTFNTTNLVVDGMALGFRLPFEDEWELAARYKDDLNNDGDIMDAGEYYPGNYASGATAPCINEAATQAVAVCNADSTSPVAGKGPNALGMYDVSGNVDEWCSDTDTIARSSEYMLASNLTCIGFSWNYSVSEHWDWLGFRLARTDTMMIFIFE